MKKLYTLTVENADGELYRKFAWDEDDIQNADMMGEVLTDMLESLEKQNDHSVFEETKEQAT